MLGVESGFDQSAKSPASAVGIAQLLPAYRNDFARLCGVGDVSEKDLLDAYTNSFLSACLFKQLIKDAEGNVALALTFYNAGKSSYGAKQAKKGEAPAAETQGYIAKIMLRKHNNKEID